MTYCLVYLLFIPSKKQEKAKRQKKNTVLENNTAGPFA